MSWLDPHLRFEHWPVSLHALSIRAFEDASIVELFTVLVTSDSLLDVVKGRPISNLTADLIWD